MGKTKSDVNSNGSAGGGSSTTSGTGAKKPPAKTTKKAASKKKSATAKKTATKKAATKKAAAKKTSAKKTPTKKTPTKKKTTSASRTSNASISANFEWRNDAQFTCRGVPFWTPLSGTPVGDLEGLQVYKPRTMVERYTAALDTVKPRNVVEIGIHQGGSTALLGVAGDFKLVSLELNADRLPKLDAFIAEQGIGDRVIPHFGVDQGDAEKVSAIMDREFGDEPIDLIIDDASHLYGPTASSFDTLFPRLRPGGLFIIEDWACDHLLCQGIRKRSAAKGNPAPARKAPHGARLRANRAPLSVLGQEAWLAMLEEPDLITRVEFDPHWVSIWKGPDAACGADPAFRLQEHYHDDYAYT